MGFLITKPKEPVPHICSLPDCRDFGVGTVWRCDRCGRTYKLVEGPIGRCWKTGWWIGWKYSDWD